MTDRQAEPRFRSKYPRPEREDGRVQFLVFLPPDLVKRIKGVANDRDEYAYHIVQRVLTNALARPEDQADWPTRAAKRKDDAQTFIEEHRSKAEPRE